MEGLRRRVGQLIRRDTDSYCDESLALLALRGRPRTCAECRRLERFVVELLGHRGSGGEQDRKLGEQALRIVKLHVHSVAFKREHT